MSFTVSIVADSISSTTGTPIRLTTFAIRYPRFIHAELMTHRIFSRNASSSRAIPVKKQLERIRQDPAKPVEWGANKPGMQSAELLTDEQVKQAEALWMEACQANIGFSERMDALNVHKQITNRIAEAFSHISVILTGTEWANFFSLRHHPMAQPEFQRLAELMVEAYRDKDRPPAHLGPNEWHLPYVTKAEQREIPRPVCLKLSVARCARVSYNNHDGTLPDTAKDVALHDALVVAKPLHASPAEHQATPFYEGATVADSFGDPPRSRWGYPFDAKWNGTIGAPDLAMPWSANFRGWFQYRQGLVGQNVTVFPWDTLV